eukprot:jgi/Picsp_1/869/NSC_04357-R1_tetratricopeptide repeat protein 13-like
MVPSTQSRSAMIRILDDYIARHSGSENEEHSPSEEGKNLSFARLNRMLLYYDMGMYRKALKDGTFLTETMDGCSFEACIVMVMVLIALGNMPPAVDKLEAMLGDDDALVHGDMRQYLRAKRIIEGIRNGSICAGDVLPIDLDRDCVEQLQLGGTNGFSNVGLSCRGGEQMMIGGSVVSTEESTDVLHTSKSADRSKESELGRAIILVNTGQYKEAIKVLDKCLALNDDAVLLATRGTAKAFAGDLEDSIQDFNKAIAMQPSIYDVYLRRSQAFAALGKYTLAHEDLEKARSLCHSNASLLARVWYETGKLHEKMQCYGLLLSDLERAMSLDEHIQKESETVKMMGMGYIGTGDLDRGIECLLQAKIHSPDDAKVLLNLGLCYKEKGMHEKAIDALTSTVLISSSSTIYVKVTAYRLLYQIYRSLGNPRKALKYIDLALDLQNVVNQPEFLYMKGSCHHALGEYNAACSAYKSAVSIDVVDLSGVEYASAAFYQKEICLWTYNNRNQRMEDISLDLSFHPQFKELWCKKRPPSDAFAREYLQYMQTPLYENIDSNSGWSNETKQLLKISDTIGKLIQYEHDGFMPNSRQQRAAGLACIECAQFLLKIATSDDPSSFSVSNEGSSSTGRGSEKLTFPAVHNSGTHKVGWRDAFDIVVKWRQLAEPSDPVIWVDLLSDQEFVAGFGSHTPMYTGETMCIRYYSNFSKAARLLYDLIVNQRAILHDFNDTAIDADTMGNLDGLLKAKTAKDIWDVIRQDAWIAIPIQSTSKKPEDSSLDAIIPELEGSRLTVSHLKSRESAINERFSIQACQLGEDTREKLVPRHASTGYEFSIRTPVTPRRWKNYACELDHIYHKLIEALRSDDSANVLCSALLFAFYWYNFMPLARGSAFCGYVMLLACRLAGGILGSEKIPNGLQVDWEAILETSPERFAQLMGSWISKSDPAVHAPVHTLTAIPDITSSLPTLESRIAALRHCGRD